MTTAPFWFLNAQATIQLSYQDNADNLSVILLRMPRDDAPPLHVHNEEDEVFHIIDGQMRFRIGDRTVLAARGDTVLAPKSIPHGFRVLSDTVDVLIVNKGWFERLVRTAARPALHDGPPRLAVPTPAMQQELAAQCAAANIRVVGPPID